MSYAWVLNSKTTRKEIGILLFVQSMTATPEELFSAEKPKATREDKSVLSGSGNALSQSSEQHKERQKQHRERNKEQYMEYKNEVHHISNFLSLQIGKA